MNVQKRASHLAVLIDADNISARLADGVFAAIAEIGDTRVRRVYGDFSNGCAKAWAEMAAKHAIVPHHQFASAGGKNGSDIGLVVDAMDLLHTGTFDGFCLVSSDSDFTRLVSRIREQGIDVFGFGEQKTPDSYRRACCRFVCVDDLVPVAPSAAPPDPQPAAARPPDLQPPSRAAAIIKSVVEGMQTRDGWVYLSELGHRLSKTSPGLIPGRFGFAKLSALVRATAPFGIEMSRTPPFRIRLAPPAAQSRPRRAGVARLRSKRA
ncbi:NYN domain-containing protein [Rhodoplanes sp. SY1]|uniref:NYN domain-containing protein n=1 Tax=Rhodoplanes sp. SY1 TaxID=3166646 RepID=UPI0038B5E5AA